MRRLGHYYANIQSEKPYSHRLSAKNGYSNNNKDNNVAAAAAAEAVATTGTKDTSRTESEAKYRMSF